MSNYCKNCYELTEKLEAKEQECEELKSELIDVKWKIEVQDIELNDNVKQLKAKNESLKESLKMFSSTLDWTLKSEVGLYQRQIDSSVPDDWEYEEVLVLVEQYIEKLKQTLTEIKEIAKGVRNYLQVPAPKDVRHEIDIILQKISECEVE